MRPLRHAAALAAFPALAIVWTWPLVTDLAGQLPGAGPGDNFTFLSSFWWMREAIATGADFFQATHMFAPAGADLTLHTHLALPAVIGATVLGFLPVAAALNITILVSLVLNGWCTYWLAWRVTGDRAAALIAGLIFAGSPFIAARLNGHFNLIGAWLIPLAALAVREAVKEKTIPGVVFPSPLENDSRYRFFWMAALGVILAMAMFVDYYLVIYAGATAMLTAVLSLREWSITKRPAPSGARRAIFLIVATLAVLEVLLIIAIAVTGGFSLNIAGLRVSARGLFNPLQMFWLLCALALALRYMPRVTTTPREGWRLPRAGVATALAFFLVGSSPILINAALLVRRGDYVTQESQWRSAPNGIDAGTLVTGNPFHPIIGERVHALYERTKINPIENSGWLGVVPVVLAIAAIRRQAAMRADAMRWATIGALFFIWSLGHHLMVFGLNTGMALPAALFRYVPILNNARMPGRALVVVYLALAMLAAFALAGWRPRNGPRRSIALAGIATAILLDYVPAPFPMTPLDTPRVYTELRNRPERGAVCELPMGIRDGFGGRGAIDDRIFLYQTIHERPLVGGFLGRLPASTLAGYESDPLLAALLRFSEGHIPDPPALPDRAQAFAGLRRNGIAFVVLNKKTATTALLNYVTQVMPLEAIGGDEARLVFVTEPAKVR